MLIEFQTLKFKNILSFGNKETIINFNRGLNLVTGVNGSGKSSAILDTLSFCLYGRPYRKININEIVNRKNKKGLQTSCVFKCDNDKYEIIRNLNPNTLKVLKNDEELQLLSSKRLNQSEIDKIIGLEYKLFKQIISLSINHNRPFLAEPIDKKRDIIEQIFNIKIFGEMLKYVKKENSDIKVDIEIRNKSLNILKETIKGLRKRISELNNAKDNFLNNKKIDLENIDNNLTKLKSDIKKLEDTITNIKKEIEIINNNVSDIDDLKEKREFVIGKINECEYKISNSNKTIKSLNKHTICPICNTNISKEHKNDELIRLDTLIEQLNDKIKEYKQIRMELEDKITKYEDLINDINVHNNNIIRYNDRIKLYNSNIDDLMIRKKEIKDRKLNIDIKSIIRESEDKINEYKILHKELKELNERMKNNDIVIAILSENGIKSYLFKKLIPILNKNINDYITLFELPINIQFNELMEEKIRTISSSDGELSYYSFSEGEKKRIDMAILLSFIKITKTLTNWNCNLLIIDELLDSAIDENGLEKLIKSLKNMTHESNICIYIISHRLQQQDYFSQFKNIIHVEKNSNDFSNISIN
ncbi:MAG: AAA family ATPase [Candidatus Pacearchaeota archaeon]